MVSGVFSYAVNGLIYVHAPTIVSLGKHDSWFSNTDNFNPGALGFQMNFGFEVEKLDPNIAYWQLEYVQWG